MGVHQLGMQSGVTVGLSSPCRDRGDVHVRHMMSSNLALDFLIPDWILSRS